MRIRPGFVALLMVMLALAATLGQLRPKPTNPATTADAAPEIEASEGTREAAPAPVAPYPETGDQVPAEPADPAGTYFGYNWRDLAASRVSTIRPGISPLRFQSIYPLAPEKIYADNIEAARAGDPQAQYQVARALDECRGVTIGDQRIESIESSNAVPDVAITQMKARWERCRPLHEIIGDDLRKWETHFEWLEKSADAGYLDALVLMASEYPAEFSGETVRQNLIEGALRAPAGDTTALSTMVTYLANFVERYDELEYTTWEFTLCQMREDICEVDAMRAYFVYWYGAEQLRLTEATAAAIQAALKNGDREALDAFIPAPDTQPQAE